MKQRNHELSLSVLYVCIKNLLAIGVFVYAAISFQRWWISLFAILFQSGIQNSLLEHTDRRHNVDPENFMSCDYCGELLYVHDVENAVHNEMQFYGWRRIEVAGRWRNICPHCIARYKPKLDDNTLTKKEVQH